MEQTTSWLNQVYQTLSKMGFRILGAIALTILGVIVIHWLCKKLKKAKFMDKLDKELMTFINSGLNIVLYVLLALSVCSVMGISTTSFVAFLTSIAVAIGVAMQGALANVAGGIMLLVFHPFHIGDYISTADGSAGTVKAITVLYTFLDTPDNRAVMVPNGQMTAGSITNFTVNGRRRMDLEIGAAYGSNIDTVKALLLDIAWKDERVEKDPQPFARLTKMGDSALTFTLRVWVKNSDYWPTYFDLMEAMKKSFDKNGISIPFPQVDVHITADDQKEA